MIEIDYRDKAIDEVMEAQCNYVHAQHCIPNRKFTREWITIEAHQPKDDPDDWQAPYIIVPKCQTISGKDEIIELPFIEHDDEMI